MPFYGKYSESILGCNWCFEEDVPGFQDPNNRSKAICVDCLHDASDLIPTGEDESK